MKYAPVALFVYNRPHHTRLTVEALQKNTLARQSDLIIFSDAAKSDAQKSEVKQVREYIRQVTGFKSIDIFEQEQNKGLANSIIDGVSMLCDRHGEVIVLEDDLETLPIFLEYMNASLKRYEKEPKVTQVSGYMYDVELNNKEEALFLPLTNSWGWATWKRAWDVFDKDAKGYAKLKEDSKLRKTFNLNNRYDYYAMLESQISGKVDSWAIRWYLSTFLINGLTLYPPKSLVLNNGFDGSGTHGERQKQLHQNFDLETGLPQPPRIIEVSKDWEAVRYNIGSRRAKFISIKEYLSKVLESLSLKKT